VAAAHTHTPYTHTVGRRGVSVFERVSGFIPVWAAVCLFISHTHNKDTVARKTSLLAGRLSRHPAASYRSSFLADTTLVTVFLVLYPHCKPAWIVRCDTCILITRPQIESGWESIQAEGIVGPSRLYDVDYLLSALKVSRRPFTSAFSLRESLAQITWLH
jgi:hypothetical protein